MTNPQQVHQDAAKWIKDVSTAVKQHKQICETYYEKFIVDKVKPTPADVAKLDAEMKRWKKLLQLIDNDLNQMEKTVVGYGRNGNGSTGNGEETLFETVKKKAG